jgi:hypothetical protein
MLVRTIWQTTKKIRKNEKMSEKKAELGLVQNCRRQRRQKTRKKERLLRRKLT